MAKAYFVYVEPFGFEEKPEDAQFWKPMLIEHEQAKNKKAPCGAFYCFLVSLPCKKLLHYLY